MLFLLFILGIINVGASVGDFITHTPAVCNGTVLSTSSAPIFSYMCTPSRTKRVKNFISETGESYFVFRVFSYYEGFYFVQILLETGESLGENCRLTGKYPQNTDMAITESVAE